MKFPCRIGRVTASALLVVTLVLGGGWGQKGHAVIAEIAWREMSPGARERVQEIMGISTIQQTASWADGVRSRDPNFRWTAPLHYANLPADAAGYDHETMCPEEGNVVSAVLMFAERVVDESLSEIERRQAMMFLVHFVGDLHQPLHAGNAEDRGGNDIDIAWFGNERRLHSIWDSGIIDAVTGREPWPLMAERLHEGVTDSDRVAWTVSDPRDSDEIRGAMLTQAVGRWVYESRRLADTHAYRAEGFNGGEVFEDGTELGQGYAEHCAGVTELRLRQAGVRLGALLNAVFESTGQ